MAEINKPDYSNIWASGGAVIPPSAAKVQVGWTAEIPPHQWENWAQNRQDTAIAYLFQRGVAEWDATTEYQANKSIIQYNGNLYKALTTNTGLVPDTNPTDWGTWPNPATVTNPGLVQLASTAEAQGWTNNTKVLTPKTLADSFKGSNLSIGGAGNSWFIKHPGGWVDQGGLVSCTATADNSQGTGSVVTLPVPVSQVLNIQATPTFSYQELGCLSAYASIVSGTQIRVVLDWSQGTGGASITQTVFWRALCRA